MARFNPLDNRSPAPSLMLSMLFYQERGGVPKRNPPVYAVYPNQSRTTLKIRRVSAIMRGDEIGRISMSLSSRVSGRGRPGRKASRAAIERHHTPAFFCTRGCSEMTAERSRTLREIAAALEEWAQFNKSGDDRQSRRSCAAKQATRKAMRLMIEHLAVLTWCEQTYGCRPPIQMVFACLKQAASWPDTKDLGGCWNWGEDFVRPKLWDGEERSFIDEVTRWANRLDAEAIRSDRSAKGSGETVADHNPSKLDEIINDVQRNLGHFQGQWQAFCDRVERYAADVEAQSLAALKNYEERAKVDYEVLGKKWRSSTKADWERETSGPQKGPLEDVINAAYAEGAPGPNYFWAQREDFEWLNTLTSLDTCFWCKPKVQNLLPWVTLAPASNVHKRQTKKWATPQDRNKYAITLKLTEDEHLLCDCAVLSIVHDNWNLGSGEGRIFSDTAYTGRYFERDKFCRMVWGTSKTEGADGRLERMWDRVKTNLEGNGPRIKEPAECSHTDDFTTVIWYSEEYHFNETQAKCIKALWSEWEGNTEGKPTLHQRTIRDKIKSENPDYRLIQTFRAKRSHASRMGSDDSQSRPGAILFGQAPQSDHTQDEAKEETQNKTPQIILRSTSNFLESRNNPVFSYSLRTLAPASIEA